MNLLTGFRNELLEPLVSHMDINAFVVADATKEERTMLDTEAAANMKRVVYRKAVGPSGSPVCYSEAVNPCMILDT